MTLASIQTFSEVRSLDVTWWPDLERPWSVFFFTTRAEECMNMCAKTATNTCKKKNKVEGRPNTPGPAWVNPNRMRRMSQYEFICHRVLASPIIFACQSSEHEQTQLYECYIRTTLSIKKTFRVKISYIRTIRNIRIRKISYIQTDQHASIASILCFWLEA